MTKSPRPSALTPQQALAQLRYKGQSRATASVIFFLLTASWMSSCAALTFSIHPNNSGALRAVIGRGDVDTGDTVRLQTLLATMPKRRRTVVYLDSPGGNLYEGMKLGRYFSAEKIKLAIEGRNGICASACALAFLGGRDEVTGKLWRAKSSTSRLGFHSFSSQFEDSRAYSAEDMRKLLQQSQFVVLDIADYLRAIGTDLEFLRIMFRASSTEMNWITDSEALKIGVHVWDESAKSMIESGGIVRP